MRKYYCFGCGRRQGVLWIKGSYIHMSDLHWHRMQIPFSFIIHNNKIHRHLYTLYMKIKLKDGICQNCYYAIPCANWIVEEDWHVSQNNGSDRGYCSCSMFVKVKFKDVWIFIFSNLNYGVMTPVIITFYYINYAYI